MDGKTVTNVSVLRAERGSYRRVTARLTSVFADIHTFSWAISGMDVNQPNRKTEKFARSVDRYSSEWRADDELVTRLTCAMADVEDQRPEQFDIGLSRIVDPDALERLFTEKASHGDCRLTLSLLGYEVHVGPDGELLIIQ